MTPIDLAGRTRAIGAPRDWSPTADGECGVLPVRDGREGRYLTMTSAWQPSPDDLRCLNLGLPIMLTVYGSIHPVVAIAVGQPSDLPQAPGEQS